MKSILLLGGKQVGVSCFKHVLEHDESWGMSTVGIVAAQPRNPGERNHDLAELASRHGIPYYEDFPNELEGVDFLVSVQYHRVLSHREIEKARCLAVNLHMAPLPEYRGANQFSFAILNNEKEFGTTLHEMIPQVDAGDILVERRFRVEDDWSAKALYDKTVEESMKMFSEHIEEVLRMTIKGQPQRGVRRERPRYFYRKRDIEGFKEVDLHWPLEKIDRHVRAFDFPGFEPAYVLLEGQKIYLSRRFC